MNGPEPAPARVPGVEVPIVWHGHAARAWLPAPLTARDVAIPTATVRATERAAAEVRRVGDRLPTAWEPLARLLLRTEGIASSNIEGLRAPVAAVVAAETGAATSAPAADAVADNLAVVDEVLVHARGAASLAVDDLHRWQARLVRHGALPSEMIGAFRTAQSWIGGRGPQDAAFVPPPPDAVPVLVDDLVSYVGEVLIDAVAQAAIAHAQLETIHPYGDGNGRLGRLLVLWILARRLDVAMPPPVSVPIARDPGGYLSGLYRFRIGEIDPWVTWFAAVVADAATSSLAWAGDVHALLESWRDRVADLRADAAARRLLDLLPTRPLVSVESVATALGVSATTARTAIEELATRGVLEAQPNAPVGAGRPRRWWLTPALVELVGGWAG